MTLTKADLQEISKIIRNELDPVKEDLSGVKEDLSGVKEDLKDVKQRVRKIETNVETMLGFLDEQDVKLHKRVSKIEKHLNLPHN